MKYGRRMVLSIVWVMLGLVLIIGGLLGHLEEFWSGMGAAFLTVGGLQIVRQIRYRTNQEYREKVDVAASDERNKFLSSRAWAWAGYCYVMVAAVGTIIFKLLGREELMMLCSGSVCVILLLYWSCYMVLRRKY